MRDSQWEPLTPPDEPEHQKKCHTCKCFIKQSGWEWEIDNGYPDELAIIWFSPCANCGTTNTHTQVRYTKA